MLLLAFAVLLVVSAAVTARPAPVQAAGPRTAVVLPGTGLTTRVVTVAWSGFDPTTPLKNSVNVVQCKQNPQSLADCFTNLPFPNSQDGNQVIGATTQGNGTGSVELEVRDAADLAELACSESNSCSVLVYQNTGTPPPEHALPAQSAVAPITFAKSQSDCPPVTKFDLKAEGEASAAELFYRWAGEKCTAADSFVLDYTETSSNDGRRSLLTKQVDLGVTSLPATAGELSDAAPAPELAYAPVDLNAVAIVYNMRDPETGKPLTDVRLSPRLVARLISASDLLSFFDDPELHALNPGVRWPANAMSEPLIRAEKNADTWLVTRWIADDGNAQKFLAGQDPYHVPVTPEWKNVSYPTDVFESRATFTGYVPRHGEREVAERVFHGVKPIETSSSSSDYTGFIGIVDLPTAERFGLPMAKIVNAAGNAVAPDDVSIAAGFNAMTRNADGTRVADPNASDPNAYPLVKVDYAMLAPSRFTGAKADVLGRFLRYAVGAGQLSMDAGYVPLPPTLVLETNAIANRISPLPPIDDPASFDSGAGGAGGFDSGSGSGGASDASAAAAGTSATTAQTKNQAKVAAYVPAASYGPAGRGWGPALLVIGLGAGLAGGAGLLWLRRRERRAATTCGFDGGEPA